MLSHVRKVFIRAQHLQLVTDAKLRKQRIYCPDLHPALSAEISEFRRRNVILSVRDQQRKCRKAIHNLVSRFWSGKALKQLLQNEPSGHDALTGLQGAPECAHLRNIGRLIAAQHQRPDARVYEEAQRRDLSFL
jgi:hypothetical protein